jgi:hypothetical protein
LEQAHPHPRLTEQAKAASQEAAELCSKKSQKLGAFFIAEKHAAKHHVPPRISPQIHHQNTTPKQRFFSKTPAKLRYRYQGILTTTIR